MFWLVLRNELQISLINKNNFLAPLCFFLIIFVIFPLLAPQFNQLLTFFPAIVILCALFIVMLSSEQIFAIDITDGYIEQLLSAGIQPKLLFLAKIISCFLLLIIPISLGVGLAGVAYNISFSFLLILLVLLLLILPLFISNSLLISLMTYGTARTSLLASLMTVPLNIPALVILALAVQNNTTISWNYVQMLFGLELIFIPIVVFLGGILIKNIANSLDTL